MPLAPSIATRPLVAARSSSCGAHARRRHTFRPHGGFIHGFIQADYLFTRLQCDFGPGNAAEAGLRVVNTTNPVVEISYTGGQYPTDAEMDRALTTFRDAGVNVIIGCTMYETGIAMVNSLERLNYSPYAVTHSNSRPSVFTPQIIGGYWQGEYLLGPTPWHRSRPGVGSVSGLTSEDYYSRYTASYNEAEAGNWAGAWNFGLGLAYVDAIERAQSLETDDVARALRDADFTDFMGRVVFDPNNQNDLSMLVVQV